MPEAEQNPELMPEPQPQSEPTVEQLQTLVETGRARRDIPDSKVVKRLIAALERPPPVKRQGWKGPPGSQWRGAKWMLEHPPQISVLPDDATAPEKMPVTREHPYAILADPTGPFPECFAVLSRNDWCRLHVQRTPWLGSRTGHLYRYTYNRRTKDNKKVIWLHR